MATCLLAGNHTSHSSAIPTYADTTETSDSAADVAKVPLHPETAQITSAIATPVLEGSSTSEQQLKQTTDSSEDNTGTPTNPQTPSASTTEAAEPSEIVRPQETTTNEVKSETLSTESSINKKDEQGDALLHATIPHEEEAVTYATESITTTEWITSEPAHSSTIPTNQESSTSTIVDKALKNTEMQKEAVKMISELPQETTKEMETTKDSVTSTTEAAKSLTVASVSNEQKPQTDHKKETNYKTNENNSVKPTLHKVSFGGKS
ncbi:unnamed protein product [Echinostoma caproni]|uniref:Flocculation protein FLO11-like n=1 Tax=Echinostoma caproni TaxID=27848 RepID=A0A183B097_9TREM|nr:unnamed protein product [Echinostoma caproni]